MNDQQARHPVLVDENLSRMLIATTIRPTDPPTFLPKRTIEHGFTQLAIDLIMSLTHPMAKLLPSGDSGRITRPSQPGSKIIGADPTRVEFGEEMDELAHVALLRGRCHLRIIGREGVEEGPGVGAKQVDVRWTIGWRGGSR